MNNIDILNILLLLLLGSVTLSCLPSDGEENQITSNDINYPIDCPEPTFLYCQHAFNKAMNISTDLTWRNITQIETFVDRFMSQSKDNHIAACKKRRDFYGCLGEKYTTCINRYHLLSKVTDPSMMLAAYLYPAFWNGFDFACNGGFTVAIYNNETYDQTLGTNFAQCQNQYLNSMQNSITNLCSNTQVFMSCVQNVYINAGSSRMGWFACEKARSQYANDCPNLRCLLLTQ
uniref:DUF725 domain-containing protein n=1 Tax=Strongyloides papillosus TaxID=174720 RepID=A0A0N5CHC5_STREA